MKISKSKKGTKKAKSLSALASQINMKQLNTKSMRKVKGGTVATMCAYHF